MRISKIEFENFRNFRDYGKIRCSTDGKVTIIYGKNGDGKTTLHQLFQWIFYGQVHFNKTTTDRLYNLQFESEQPYGSTFDVMGRIDFEHEGVQYSLTRTYKYKKGIDDSEKIGEDFSLNQRDEDFNWKRVDRPKEVIEKMLPSGLSEYFFFDGESMIADLRVKGRDSAGKLRKALYSMFDLDVLEAAINHIGRTDLRTTVLGKLYLSKGNISSGSEISTLKYNIEQAQARIDEYTDRLNKAKSDKEEKHQLITEISEKIGGTKSKAEYEARRKELRAQRDLFLKNAEAQQSDFGKEVMDMYPFLLLSKAVEDAKRKIHMKAEQSKLPTGVTKSLVTYLLKDGTTECICGQPLCEEQKDHIRKYLAELPPSYTYLYKEFTRNAIRWGENYDKSIFKGYLFAQDATATIRKSWVELKEAWIKFDENLASTNLSNAYPLTKILEHYMYCHVFCKPEYDMIHMDEEFLLIDECTVKGTIYYSKDHVIKVINNNSLMQEVIDGATRYVNCLNSIVEDDGGVPGCMKTYLKSIDSTERQIICNIIKKSILDKGLIVPKMLVLKYFLQIESSSASKND